MCGRYTLKTPAEQIEALLHAELALGRARDDEGDESPAGIATAALPARYNIAPTQRAPVVAANYKPEGGPPHIDLFHWGLIPSWAKDASIASRLINARSETLAEKPAFRRAYQQRRCLVLADGFYEWQKLGAGDPTRPASPDEKRLDERRSDKKRPAKQAWHFRLRDGALFAFAGLWERWRDGDGDEIASFTVITTEANRLLVDKHHRMPVILPPATWRRWLDTTISQPADLQPLLVPYDPQAMEAWPVSSRVNSAAFDDAACVEPIGAGDGEEPAPANAAPQAVGRATRAVAVDPRQGGLFEG